MNEVKRQKTENARPIHVKCDYYIPLKRRNCLMQRKAGNKYCSEHMKYATGASESQRVPCPLDPNHSVFSYDLEKHLLKCNSRPKEASEPWFLERNNALLRGTSVYRDETSEDDGMSEKELYDKYICVLRATEKVFGALEKRIRAHRGLEPRLAEVLHKKHALQQSSLIGNLKELGLLLEDVFYVEFGCGKAELSRTLNLCVLDEVKKGDAKEVNKKGDPQEECAVYGFGFVDRGVNRMKMDPKIVKECAAEDVLRPVIRRTRMDIEHLDMDAFVADIAPQRVVGISKHLCGAATDLTLKLLLNSSLLEKKTFSGLLIAMCCRHVCDYKQLMPESRAFLATHGFSTPESFGTLKKAVSWAVTGSRGSGDQAYHVSGLKIAEREELGFLARRLIDESRVHALNALLLKQGFRAGMFLYTERDVTLENSCLYIIPEENLEKGL